MNTPTNISTLPPGVVSLARSAFEAAREGDVQSFAHRFAGAALILVDRGEMVTESSGPKLADRFADIGSGFSHQITNAIASKAAA